MESRKYVDVYEQGFCCESSSYNVASLIKALKMQLEFMVKKDNNNWLTVKLQELNNISENIFEYLPGYSGKYDVENLTDQLFSYMVKKHPDGAWPKADRVEFYNNSQIYVEFKEWINRLFNLEDEIHEKITLKLWKEYCTDVDVDFKQGDEFRYIVHSGYNIIKLPGLPNYTKNRHEEGDFVSASLITNKQMHLYNGNVALILEPNESIVATAIEDAGTRIENKQDINTILDFGNGTFVNTRLDRIESIPTKIQSPQQLNDDFIKSLEERNLDPLDEGWPINEIILDDRKIKVKGVFFRITEKQMATVNNFNQSLNDYVRAHNMSIMYKVPLIVVNVDKYREQSESIEVSEDFKQYIKDSLNNNDDVYRLRRFIDEVAIGGELSEDYCNALREGIKKYEESLLRKKDEEFER